MFIENCNERKFEKNNVQKYELAYFTDTMMLADPVSLKWWNKFSIFRVHIPSHEDLMLMKFLFCLGNVQTS